MMFFKCVKVDLKKIIKWHYIVFVSAMIFLSFVEVKAQPLEIKISNKQPLRLNKTIVLNELPQAIGESDRIELVQVSKDEFQAKHGSLLRMDYRDNNDYVDLFYPKTIILGPNTMVPLVYKLMPNPARKHYVNDLLTVEGSTSIAYPSGYKGRVILSGSDGATLIRSLKGKSITLDKGEAELGDVQLAEVSMHHTDKDKSKDNTVTILTGGSGELSFSQKVGDKPLMLAAINDKIVSKRRLKVGEELPLKDLPDHYKKGEGITLSMKDDGMIGIKKGSLVRVDYRDEQDIFDVFYPENIEIPSQSCIPLNFTLYYGPGQPHWKDSNFTAGDKSEISFPPDYKGKAILIGKGGATLKRMPGDKLMELIKGEAYLVEF